jgi:hypothetical protein
MSEADTMLSLIVVQVVKNAESYHDVCLSESRVIPRTLCRQLRKFPWHRVSALAELVPAQILPWLPEVEYLGFDINPSYIAFRHG